MAEQTVELAPGESRTIAFEAIPAVAKTYQVSVDRLSGSFKAIAPPFDPWSYDFNGDGIIDTSEMLAAVNDQAAGIITPEQVQQVIDLWAVAPPPPAAEFWVQGLAWPEHFTKYGEDYGRIIRWRAIALLDEHGYDPATGEGDWHFPDTGSEAVDVSEALHFIMPEGWVGAKLEEISPGRWAWVPGSTIIRLFFETDQGWYGFLDDSPWLLNIPNGGTITFQVTSSGARNWEVA